MNVKAGQLYRKYSEAYGDSREFYIIEVSDSHVLIAVVEGDGVHQHPHWFTAGFIMECTLIGQLTDKELFHYKIAGRLP